MDIFNVAPPLADHRIPYGTDPLQFGDLRLPKLKPGAKAPLVVFVHGGWWKSFYNLEYGGHLCNALKSAGIATWSMEYRRVGDAGGGWPGTMQDVAAGFDFLSPLAQTYPIDLDRIVVTGHSAGGHLALWLAGRHHIPHTSPLYEPQPRLSPLGVVGLAAAADLRLTIDLGGLFHFSSGKPATIALMGGTPVEFPDRYNAANPGDLLPLSVPQVLIQGSEDDQIAPDVPKRYAESARRQGDHVEIKIVPGADHFAVVDPTSSAWPTVQDALTHTLRGKPHHP